MVLILHQHDTKCLPWVSPHIRVEWIPNCHCTPSLVSIKISPTFFLIYISSKIFPSSLYTFPHLSTSAVHSNLTYLLSIYLPACYQPIIYEARTLQRDCFAYAAHMSDANTCMSLARRTSGTLDLCPILKKAMNCVSDPCWL